MEIQFDFEELRLSDEGLMAWGTATLTEVGTEYPGEFYVSHIELVGGLNLRERGNGPLGFPNAFLDTLFKVIANQIENDKTPAGKSAALEWADAIDGNAPASIVPALKPRRGMPMAHVGHNAASRIEYALSDRVYVASLEQGR